MTMWIKKNDLSPFLRQLERGEREEETFMTCFQRQSTVRLEKEGASRESPPGWIELEWGSMLPCYPAVSLS